MFGYVGVSQLNLISMLSKLTDSSNSILAVDDSSFSPLQLHQTFLLSSTMVTSGKVFRQMVYPEPDTNLPYIFRIEENTLENPRRHLQFTIEDFLDNAFV